MGLVNLDGLLLCRRPTCASQDALQLPKPHALDLPNMEFPDLSARDQALEQTVCFRASEPWHIGGNCELGSFGHVIARFGD